MVLEYDPQPPLDTGSPKKVSTLLLEQLRGTLEELEQHNSDM